MSSMNSVKDLCRFAVRSWLALIFVGCSGYEVGSLLREAAIIHVLGVRG
jgi:hypothetical protein